MKMNRRMRFTHTMRAELAALLVTALPFAAQTVEPPPRTSFSNKAVHFIVPDKTCVILKHGDLQAVVVDNLTRAALSTIEPAKSNFLL